MVRAVDKQFGCQVLRECQRRSRHNVDLAARREEQSSAKLKELFVADMSPLFARKRGPTDAKSVRRSTQPAPVQDTRSTRSLDIFLARLPSHLSLKGPPDMFGEPRDVGPSIVQTAPARQSPVQGHQAGATPTQLFRQSLCLPSLTPPLRLHLWGASKDAESKVWASSHPLARHLPYLSRLRLRSLVALTPKHPSKEVPELESWAQQHNVQIHWIQIAKWKDSGSKCITREIAEQVLSLILASEAQSLLLIALTPQPTAAILALLRLLQGHPLESIYPEMHRALRAGMEGEADEDDRVDCDKWLQGWVGKECSLTVCRSQVSDWIWPTGTTLYWLSGRGSHTNTASDTWGDSTGPSIASTTHSARSSAPHSRQSSMGSVGAAVPNHAEQSRTSQVGLSRSAAAALLLQGGSSQVAKSLSSSQWRPNISHPFLKLRLTPESSTPRAKEIPSSIALARATAKTAAELPSVNVLGPESAVTPAPVADGSADTSTCDVPRPVKGRKRSLTISEGQCTNRSGADSTFAVMSEAAAAAAITCTGFSIDGAGAAEQLGISPGKGRAHHADRLSAPATLRATHPKSADQSVQDCCQEDDASHDGYDSPRTPTQPGRHSVARPPLHASVAFDGSAEGKPLPAWLADQSMSDRSAEYCDADGDEMDEDDADHSTPKAASRTNPMNQVGDVTTNSYGFHDGEDITEGRRSSISMLAPASARRASYSLVQPRQRPSAASAPADGTGGASGSTDSNRQEDGGSHSLASPNSLSLPPHGHQEDGEEKRAVTPTKARLNAATRVLDHCQPADESMPGSSRFGAIGETFDRASTQRSDSLAETADGASVPSKQRLERGFTAAPESLYDSDQTRDAVGPPQSLSDGLLREATVDGQGSHKSSLRGQDQQHVSVNYTAVICDDEIEDREELDDDGQHDHVDTDEDEEEEQEQDEEDEEEEEEEDEEDEEQDEDDQDLNERLEALDLA
ncbi:unnamed protein product [Parajaminaea phylloscopi]